MARIFFSYCHADEIFCDMLQKHLAALKYQGLIETWHDRQIRAGDQFENTIDRELNEAEIILLLVSSDFISSRYCYEIEMRRAMERHHAGEARVIPIILRSCDWHDTPFGKLMAAPRDGKPVKSWPDIDEGFLDVVRQIKAALPTQSAASSKHISAVQGSMPISNRPRSANLTIKKNFSEADKDAFLEDSYVYIANYFDNSLQELQARNPSLVTRFRKVDANHFTAVIYKDGAAASRCKIMLGGMFGRSITFSFNDQASDNSCNESLSVQADDSHLFLRGMGMAFRGHEATQNLTQEGAAEAYWSLLLQALK